MSEDAKKITLSRSYWLNGFKQNLSISDNGEISIVDNTKRAYFFGSSIDLLEKGMTYHRLFIDCNFSKESNLKVCIRSSDNPYILIGQSPIKIDEYLLDPNVTLDNKEELFKDNESVQYHKTNDMLLHAIKGRYIWIYMCIFDIDEQHSMVNSLTLEYPQNSFVEYLPEIYHANNDFLKRYLSIFQSIYLDMERKIDKLPALLDSDLATGEGLEYLASWLGIYNEGGILNEEQFRYLVQNAIYLNKTKGTVKSIIDMVKLYTGEEPFVVEYFNLKNSIQTDRYRKQLYDEIYTSSQYEFSVIIQDDTCFKNGCKIDSLAKLIDKVRPAHTIAKIIVLSKDIRLGLHSYLGINSVLEKHTGASISNTSKMNGTFYLNA